MQFIKKSTSSLLNSASPCETHTHTSVKSGQILRSHTRLEKAASLSSSDSIRWFLARRQVVRGSPERYCTIILGGKRQSHLGIEKFSLSLLQYSIVAHTVAPRLFFFTVGTRGDNINIYVTIRRSPMGVRCFSSSSCVYMLLSLATVLVYCAVTFGIPCV